MIPPGKGHNAKSSKLLLLSGNHSETGHVTAQCAIAQSCDSTMCFPAGNPHSQGPEVPGGPWGSAQSRIK